MNDIEILEKLLKKDKCNIGYYMAYIFDEKEKQAIENLIQRNKDLEQIEKEHKEENGRLREENKNLEKELEEKDMQHELELIGKEEFTKANMAEIIEHYYTANEDCIPISKLKEIVDLYNNTLQCTRKYNQELADILCDLQELLKESEK